MLDPNIEVIKQAVKKKDEVRGLQRIFGLFCGKLNKLNNTGARLLGSTTLKLLKKIAWTNVLMLHLIIRETITDTLHSLT